MLNKLKFLIIGYLGVLIVWWLVIFTKNQENTSSSFWFGAAYALIALIGSLIGLFVVAKRWGGLKSAVGRALTFLSLGLFGLALGQIIWSYYNLFVNVEVPYPSIADAGYFSIVPFYGISMIILAKVGGAGYTIKSIKNRLLVFAVPVLFLIVSYVIFLRGIEVDLSNPIRTFFDFGQPLGEAIVISIALLAWQLSRSLLGGMMRKKIFFIVGALILQYVTDFLFYYRNAREMYQNGDVVDLMYAISFTVMTVGLLSFANTKSSQFADNQDGEA